MSKIISSSHARDRGNSDNETLWSKLTPDKLKHLVAGGVAGAVSRTSVSPLERLKILYQVQIDSKENRKFQGITSSLRTIWREEGIRGYYKGNGTNVIRIVPYAAVQFAAYEEFKKLLKISSDAREQSTFKRILAGALAGITSVTATYPLDLVRTRLSIQQEGSHKKYKNITQTFKVILKEEGGFFSGALYRGLVPTAMGVAPYVGLNFAIYEMLKGHVMNNIFSTDDTRSQLMLDEEMPMLWKMTCGAISGATAQSIAYPLDVIRRRMQMKGARSDLFPYTSTPNAILTMYRVEGMGSFYKGMIPNLLKVAPSTGITFVTYEFTKARLYGIPIKWKLWN